MMLYDSGSPVFVSDINMLKEIHTKEGIKIFDLGDVSCVAMGITWKEGDVYLKELEYKEYYQIDDNRYKDHFLVNIG